MRKAYLLLVTIIMLTQTIRAQQETPYFNTLRTENGLSHNKVNCILQDKRGFIWFGTEDGLNRYDGKYFTIFRKTPGDTTCISGNIISDLLEDENGIIWIATEDGGLSAYDYRQSPDKQFRQYRYTDGSEKSIPDNHVNAIVDDQHGYLWVGTGNYRTRRFNKKTGEFSHPVKTGTTAILSLSMDANDSVWVGRAGGGLLKINARTLKYSADRRYDDLYAKLSHVSVTALFRDHNNDMWYGAWDKVLYHYDHVRDREESFSYTPGKNSFPNDEVNAFAEDKANRLWMGGKDSGLIVYDPAQHHFSHYRHQPFADGSIVNDHINDVYIDRNNIVWVATNNGISYHNPLYYPFKQVFLPGTGKDISIYDFYKDAGGRLWIGTNDGIFIKPPGKQPFEHRQLSWKGQPLSVTKFFQDSDGTFYIGTDYTLFIYDTLKQTLSTLPNTEGDPVMKKLISSRIVSIVKDTMDTHPVLIVSPYGHYLSYYDFKEQHWVTRSDSVHAILKRYNIKDNLIRKMYKAASGNIWLATTRHGLGDWPQKDGQQIKYLKGISNDDVYDIMEGQAGNIWISTYGGGLNYLDVHTQKAQHIPESSNLTEGLQTDKDGNVWMVCNGHIHKYDPAAKIYSCYEPPTLKKDGGVNGYMYQDEQGNIYVGGTNYYLSFQPEKISLINTEPVVYLTDFKIFNNSYSGLLQKQTIELDYKQNYFSIEFSAPEFSGDNIQYSYMLAGVDKTWNNVGKRNFAYYSNLKGGEYTFLVKASNWKGVFGNRVTALHITIIPPFWTRWWFYLVCTLVIAAAIYLLYRYRINELLKRHAIRNGIAQDLHDSVGSTLSGISVYSEVAKIYNDQQKTEQLKELLNTIGHTANEMISEMSDIVWAINPKNDHVSSIVKRMESYAKPLCTAKKIQFIFSCDQKIEDLNLAMNQRKNFYLIFKEAVNNALKHAACSFIKVNISYRKNMLELDIEDDGIGFDHDAVKSPEVLTLSGNGLSNIRHRASEMNADLGIESEPLKGTYLKLSFPVT
ncbi:sensor histidine kinase [Chitinophaga pinensis]|uniref:Histidine kinase n=1 Tax=Chitinophaga pinensis (strain ATCC 43595 / DSM 2588 / LMG 13176 / NBRC 15968 / NCIMB 11800 / UQM 2034) TaxID=485918 RepID=A0A979G6B9_CHIPD|nr:sensor histidine kinase [Chitinophaga pinensis]ACU61617.1 histidine kinase [Chitinophaga pinensis DSM 2588]